MNESSNSAEISKARICKFGRCYLDKIERKVYKGGTLLDISSKAFDVLQLLIERAGEVLTKDEILEQVWADSFVEEGNLAVHISKLRKLLGATKAEPYIATVSGSGYRFVSRVFPIDEDVWQFHLINNPGINSNFSEDGPEYDSIAVLPLNNETGDEEIDYLADGLTESIINNLSYVSDLRVLARNTVFRFKDKEIDVQEVGKRLGVSTVLTGRIRVVRDNLIIGVELTKTADGGQLWGTSLNEPFEDVFEIQEKITRSILDNLKTQLDLAVKKANASKVTENTESYRLYLKGKYLVNKKSLKDIEKAIECFQQSISKDPVNAHSYVELANCFRLLYSYDQLSLQDAVNKLTPLLKKATKLNGLMPELFVFKGIIKMYLEFNFKESEKYLVKALMINPNSLIARYRYSQMLVYCCRFSEALIQMKECARLDPVSLISNKRIARMFYFIGQFRNSVIKLEECLELESEDFETHLLLGINFVELEKYNDAFNAFEKSLKLQYHFETLSMIGYANAKAGRKKEAQNILKELEEKSKRYYIAPQYFGIIHSGLGEIEQAFKYLNKTLIECNSDIISLKCDPRWAPIRSDPRYQSMLLKIGLPIK